jgi:hypothetical protein
MILLDLARRNREGGKSLANGIKPDRGAALAGGQSTLYAARWRHDGQFAGWKRPFDDPILY